MPMCNIYLDEGPSYSVRVVDNSEEWLRKFRSIGYMRLYDVPDETLERWRRIEKEFEDLQEEIENFGE